MRKKLLSVFTVLLALFCLIGCESEEISQEKGDAVFSDFAAKDLDGNLVNESILKKKKLTMINIWATFCGPCIREMPALAKLSEEFESEMQIVGIVLDLCDQNGNVLSDKQAAALDIMDETGAHYLHLAPSASLNQAYLGGVIAVPETVFVDSDGHIIGNSYSGARSEKEWRSIIEALLENME